MIKMKRNVVIVNNSITNFTLVQAVYVADERMQQCAKLYLSCYFSSHFGQVVHVVVDY